MRTDARRARRVTAAATVALSALLAPMLTAGASAPRSVVRAVPTPGTNEAVITVKVGGDRTAANAVAPLPGVVLGLFDAATGGTAAFTCTSDTDGDCNFVVPDTEPNGVNRNRRFWVRQISAPAGWFTNPTLRTGQATAAGSEATPYVFQTGNQLQAGETYRSTEQFMVGSGDNNRVASGGVWQTSRVNPVLPATCGLDVALILDLSGSTSADLPQLKSAANTFVDSLVGTPSRMSLFSFSDDSPASGATQNFPFLTSVSTPAGAAEMKSRYAGWTSGGGTNWDRGFATAAGAIPIYDIAVMITDGNPTRYTSPPQGPGSFNRLREVENAIFSANALTIQGTRIIAFGVGAGVTDPNTAFNLRSISGPTAFNGSNGDVADYYQTGNYAAAGAALRALALGNCLGSLSVVKQIVPSTNTGDDVTGATPAGADWIFVGTTTTPGVGGLPAQKQTTNDGTGSVNFPLTFPGGVTSAPVDVTETGRLGYTLVTQSGQNAVCTNLNTGQPVPVTNTGALSFTVNVPSTEAVSCTVYNREPPSDVAVVVNKRWVINGQTYAEGQQPTGFLASLTLTGPSIAPASPQEWGVARPGFAQNGTTTMQETTQLTRPFCTATPGRVTSANGAAVDFPLPFTATLTQSPLNSYTITNTVTCQTLLSLDKVVAGGLPADRPPKTAWTVSAIEPEGALEGPSGPGGAPATTVTPNVVYQLAESAGDPRFPQLDNRTNQNAPLSTGSMNCVELAPNGNVIPGFSDGINGGVTVPLGSHVRCTAFNVAAVLSLRKQVTNDDGGTALPSNWQLTATPIGPLPLPPGLGPVTVPGSDDILGTGFTVRPNTDYRLTESTVAGYSQVGMGCVLLSRANQGNIVNLQPTDVSVCTFTNDDQPAKLTLAKQVIINNGGTAGPRDWTLSATGTATPITGLHGDPAITNAIVDAGTYTLSETGGPAGYAPASEWVCIGTGGTQRGPTVIVPNGGEIACAIANDDQPAKLTLIKEVVNGNGGTAVGTDWTLSAAGPTPISGMTGTAAVTAAVVDAGSYNLSESGPAGYIPSAWTCTGGTLTGDTVVVPNGGDVTCRIRNDDQPAELTLVKRVVNGNGGTAVGTDWTLSAAGPTPISGMTGTAAVTAAVVDAGSYNLSETGPAGYAASVWTCVGGRVTGSTVVVPSGGSVTCTIINDDQPARLTLVKMVRQGTPALPDQATDWTLSAAGPTPISGATSSAAVTAAVVTPGGYTLSETGPAGYTASAWTCTVGTLTGTTVQVPLGSDVTCTITNSASPTWTLAKSSAPPSGATVGPGGLITYTVTAIKLAGVADPTNLVVTDNLSQVLDNATLVAGSITASTGTAVLNGTNLVWTIPTLSGAQTVRYTVRVNDGAYGVQLRNAVTGTGPVPPEECPPPSTVSGLTSAGSSVLAQSSDDPCSTLHVTPRWTLVKASNPASGSIVAPGSTVTYRLTVTNVTAAVVSNAIVTDDLSDALAHGTLVAVPTGATLNGTVLRWTVPTLPANGDAATLVYQIRIDAGAMGVRIDNVATPGPGGSCTTCQTLHATSKPTAPPLLPGTGSDTGRALWLAALVLSLGTGLVLVARRRRRPAT